VIVGVHEEKTLKEIRVSCWAKKPNVSRVEIKVFKQDTDTLNRFEFFLLRLLLLPVRKPINLWS